MGRLSALTMKLKGGACTEGALAFYNPENELDDLIWIPRSQIMNLEEVVDSLPAGEWWTIEEEVNIEIPNWLVEEKGLDPYAEEVD